MLFTIPGAACASWFPKNTFVVGPGATPVDQLPAVFQKSSPPAPVHTDCADAVRPTPSAPTPTAAMTTARPLLFVDRATPISELIPTTPTRPRILIANLHHLDPQPKSSLQKQRTSTELQNRTNIVLHHRLGNPESPKTLRRWPVKPRQGHVPHVPDRLPPRRRRVVRPRAQRPKAAEE